MGKSGSDREWGVIKMILKNKNGEIRRVWRLLLLVSPFLLAAYLLRYIPVRIQTRILINQGLSESSALAQARYMFLEDPTGASIVGIIQGSLWYVLVYLLVRSIEKQPCTLRSFGLAPNKNNPVLLILGVVLGLIMFFIYFAVDITFDKSPIAWSPEKIGVLQIILVSLDMLANGFGEETAFRAYWQRVLVEHHGMWTGIILASTSFVLLHLLVAQFTVITIIAGISIACLFGILYVWTESVYLVGAMHATLNLAPRLLGQWPSDVSLLIVNSLTLAIAVILYFRFANGEQ